MKNLIVFALLVGILRCAPNTKCAHDCPSSLLAFLIPPLRTENIMVTHTNAITSFQINENHTLSALPVVDATNLGILAGSVHYSGEYIFGACNDSTQVASIFINRKNGIPQIMDLQSTTVNPDAITQTNSGEFVYTLGSNNVDVFRFNRVTGRLAFLTTYPTSDSGSVIVTQDDRWLLRTEGTTNRIYTYSILSNGELELRTQIDPVSTEQPSAIAFHPQNPNLIVVANRSTNDVRVFRLDSNTGVLTRLGNAFASLGNPALPKFAPGTNFLYLSLLATDLAVFEIDADTGGISTLPSETGFNSSLWVDVDTSGNYLSLTDDNDAVVYYYKINRDTAALQLLDSQSVAGPFVGLFTTTEHY